jgi:hypothetical protein
MRQLNLQFIDFVDFRSTIFDISVQEVEIWVQETNSIC